MLDLSDNQLSGEIPLEIGNLTNLTYLVLSWNNLSGSIPTEIGQLANLTNLSLTFESLPSRNEIVCFVSFSYSIFETKLTQGAEHLFI